LAFQAWTYFCWITEGNRKFHIAPRNAEGSREVPGRDLLYRHFESLCI
jgi:hypothetical protein